MAEHPLKIFESVDHDLFKLVEETRQLALSDGALSRKFKLLISLALDAAHGASGGVTSLTRAALTAGATKEEIAETIRVAHYISGVGSVYTSAPAFREIFQPE